MTSAEYGKFLFFGGPVLVPQSYGLWLAATLVLGAAGHRARASGIRWRFIDRHPTHGREP